VAHGKDVHAGKIGVGLLTAQARCPLAVKGSPQSEQPWRCRPLPTTLKTTRSSVCGSKALLSKAILPSI